MSTRVYRILQGSILLGLGWLLFYKFFTGKLYYYINERFFDLVTLAAAGFLLLGYVVLAYRHEHADAEAEDHYHTHDHHHSEADSNPWSLVIVALPLLLGFVIPTKPLDASVIQSRGIANKSLFGVDAADEGVELSQPADQRTILDWIQAFNYSDDPAEFTGQTADVIGFVYHDPRLPEDQFLVGRLAVTCCVADAFAIGMVVAGPEAPAMVENTWVHVSGTVDVTEVAGRTLPLIRTERITPTDPPAQPYLFP
jgi:putative membrane protein